MRCKYCGREFERPKGKPMKFCSIECRTASYKENIEHAPITIQKCVVCGNEFEVRGNIDKKCCSPECKRIRQAEQTKAWHDSRKKTIVDDPCECKRVKKCYYGDFYTRVCMFSLMEGKIRGGYPSECTHYKERK